MNKRVVPLKTAEKLMSGHKKYLTSLRYEYAHPNAFGSIHACIEEMDATYPNDADFNRRVMEFLEECESTQTQFMLLAMLGDDPDGWR